MKQITQKELIELIKDKQDNAINMYEAAKKDKELWYLESIKRRFINQAYIDAYQDLICYLDSVEIVPERSK